jgi:hypothetical protein
MALPSSKKGAGWNTAATVHAPPPSWASGLGTPAVPGNSQSAATAAVQSAQSWQSNSGSDSSSGSSWKPPSFSDFEDQFSKMESMSNRVADNQLARQEKAWNLASQFRGVEDTREHQQQLELNRNSSASEMARLQANLGSQEKIASGSEAGQTQRLGMSEAGQTQRLGMSEAGQNWRSQLESNTQKSIASLQDSGETARNQYQWNTQKDIAGIQESGATGRTRLETENQWRIASLQDAGETQRNQYQWNTQKDIASLQDTGETTRTNIVDSGNTLRNRESIQSEERKQAAGHSQEKYMEGYKQELGEKTKLQDAARAAAAFKKF